MGKTNTPLTFLTTAEFMSEHQTEFNALIEKGHAIRVEERNDFDIFLDPLAWRTWTDTVTGKIANLDMAIKAARVAKKLREKTK